MQSSNAVNSLMAAAESPNDFSFKQTKDVAIKGESFSATLSSVTSINASKANVTNLTKADSQEVTADNNKSYVQVDTSGSAKVKADDSKSNTENAEELNDKVNEVADKIKNVIKDEMDVSDEDIEEAMETLGLTAIDLFDPKNLASLVLELSDSTDQVSLVLSDEMNSIFEQSFDLVEQLLEDTGFSVQDLKEITVSLNFELDAENLGQAPVELSVENTDAAAENENFSAVEQAPEEETKIPVEAVKTQEVDSTEETSAETVEDSSETTEAPVVVEEKNLDSSSENSQNEADTSLTDKDVEAKASEKEIKVDQSLVDNFTVKPEITFSQETNEVSLPTGETVSVDDMIDQIVEQAKVLSSQDSTTMEMTLNPEGLGKIFMEVTQKGDEVVAKLFTENDATKQALESQMANLRTELNSTSQKVTSIEVSVGTHQFEQNLEENARQEQNQEQERQEGSFRRRGINLNLNSLDELSGLMTEEETLVAQMMRDSGNTLNYQA